MDSRNRSEWARKMVVMVVVVLLRRGFWGK
jgi:hypothetical protein